ncbi:hypothetical protein B1T48_14350 [Mycobacterium persicum]|nr:hypothetical protein B1T48_14350 [Mycobacterium persicum]
MSQQLSVTIVIPAYNEAEFIGNCLESCIAQCSLPEEIIVVNNNSVDETASIVYRYQAENPHINIRLLHQNDRQGITPTRNLGFDNASHDVIGRIDADSCISPDWVQTIRRCFQDPDIAAVTGPVFYYDMPLRRFILWLDDKTRQMLHRNARDEGFLYGSNMAIRASAWKEVRQLTHPDTENLLHEDIDLALTLVENNLPIAYDPTLVAGLSGRRVESSPRDFYRYATRYGRTTRLHGMRSRMAPIVTAILLLGYFPVHAIRRSYDAENRKLSFPIKAVQRERAAFRNAPDTRAFQTAPRGSQPDAAGVGRTRTPPTEPALTAPRLRPHRRSAPAPRT